MIKAWIPIVTLVVAFTGGCATSYQSKGFTGGFSETQVSANSFQVYFQGNGYT